MGYSNLTVTGSLEKEGAITISFLVENVGKVKGAEVAQLYLGFPATAGEPPLQLKGFRKTQLLSAGVKESVSFLLRKRDLSIWDINVHGWSQAAGTFTIMIGSSSRDIRLEGSLGSLVQ